MEAPRADALLSVVTSEEITQAIRQMPRRGGVEHFIRMLGFTGALCPRRAPRAVSLRGAVVRTTRRGTLRLHVVRQRQPICAATLRPLLRGWTADDPAAHHLVLLIEPRAQRVAIGCTALDGGLRHIVFEPGAVRASDVDTVREIAAAGTQSGSAAAFEIARALDRRTLTRRFFRDVRAVRDLVSRSWLNMPAAPVQDRDALALLLLSRLMFLYFLQQKQLLDARERFLPELLTNWQRAPARGSFYRCVLRPLFFGVLNRRVERRTPRARKLGRLPYLNGGLFERHRLERQHARLDLPDDVAASIFSMLLERYRFTSSDAADPVTEGIGGGIDPELLGQIFEELMANERRAATGTFYTPSDAVDRLVVETLVQHLSAECGVDESSLVRMFAGEAVSDDASACTRLRQTCASLRVLDPACGSGAFLLGALARMTRLVAAVEPTSAFDSIRRDIVARSLYGVDLLGDAALICSLRLWLALVPDCRAVEDVPPLPNLDRCIRQGDALIDPLDTRDTTVTALSPELRAVVRQLEPAGRDYMASEPEARGTLRRRIHRLERGLARLWLETLTRRLAREIAELHARAEDRDLFGEPSTAALQARALIPAHAHRLDELTSLRSALHDTGALPFFSFRVHFAADGAGFDVVLSNPPWVRAHAWPAATASLLRERYRVCAAAGWPYACELTRTPRGAGAQVDLAFLFLERVLDLLREGGTLGLLLPAKLLRSLAPGGARELLLSDAPVTYVEDHSLDQRAIFAADAFTSVIIARRTSQPATPDVRIRMTRSGVTDLEFDIPRSDLPLRHDDLRAPWLIAPPEVRAALRAMQRAGPSLGSEIEIRRGAMTAANDRMIVTHAEPKLGDLVEVTTARGTRGVVELECIRPVLRGSDVRAWRAAHSSYVLWSPVNEDRAARTPRRLSALLQRERHERGASRADDGRLQRVSSGMFGHKVVWSDLATDLRAAAVPHSVRACGVDRPVIPLNTVYFAPVPDRPTALLLCAYLNSLPLRTFARAIAERAKDAHFRFFAWTIAVLPLPVDWRVNRSAEVLIRIAEQAQEAGGLADGPRRELDLAAARCYALDAAHVAALACFDRWLRGVS